MAVTAHPGEVGRAIMVDKQIERRRDEAVTRLAPDASGAIENT
jgi:hypothetical protein